MAVERWSLTLESGAVTPFTPSSEAHIALLERKLARVKSSATPLGRAKPGFVRELEARRFEEDPDAFGRHVATSRIGADDEMVEPLIAIGQGVDHSEPVELRAAAEAADAESDLGDDAGAAAAPSVGCVRQLLARCMGALITRLPGRELELRTVWKWARAALALCDRCGRRRQPVAVADSERQPAQSAPHAVTVRA
ncbi:hypothetical protein KFE25_003124 [Diacronema lutheri]|uniref:Uncharacterized protein n=1 Tax=Diacronema lutheri TaxID=2081491 RepID=A0A8J5XAF1_DIALT|nr:hypothetical protein KFE25_003124 [Diacronema lutheri]